MSKKRMVKAKRGITFTLYILEKLKYKEYCHYEFSSNLVRNAAYLRALERKGLIKGEVKKRGNWNKKAKVYHLTTKGRKALETWEKIKSLFGVTELEELI